jgi:serine/threonine-protein kinase
VTRDDWRRVEPILTKAVLLPERDRAALLDSVPLDDAARRRIVAILRQSATRSPSVAAAGRAAAPGPAGATPPGEITPGPPVPVLGSGDALDGRRFVIVRQIGRGGMGDVYLAQDTTLGTLVALKILPSDERLIMEAQRAAVCSDHPNVVTVHNVLRTSFDDQPIGVLVMDYVAGTPASRLLDDGPVELARALRWTREVAAAIAHAHDRNVLHCDLKPANVLITPDDHAMVLDFGIARATFDAANEAEPLRGTIPYMAPEQLLARVFSPAGDIYSLGVTLFELLTGRRPFEGDDLMLRIQIVATDPPSVSDIVSGVPPALAAVVRRALEKDADDRFRSARAFDRALEDVEADGMAAAKRSEAFADSGRDSAARPSIAVLPFANLSPDQDTDYFSDGLTEELINALSQVEGLRVVSRTSAFEFKGKAVSIRTVGTQLGVNTVLEGSVRKSGNRLRITAQLANVKDGCQLWATRFDRTMADIFEIQDEIAQTIAHTLEVRFAGREGRPLLSRPTADMEAYHLYLRGRFQWNKRSGEGFDKAREFFAAALARDSRLAQAYAGLADYYISVASWGLTVPDPAWSEADQAARKALAIDPTLADAHVALAAIRTYYEWNWAEGEREFRRARDLNPSDTNALVQHATQLIQRVRLDEARATMALALELDPLSATVNTYVAGVAYYSRQYQQALDLCQRGFEFAPDDIELHCVLALTSEAQGRYDDAIAAFERARILSHDYPVVVAALAAAHARAGQQTRSHELMASLEDIGRVRYVPPVAWAWVHIGLGDVERALECVEQAIDAHDVLVGYLAVGPTYDALRSHARFPGLLRKIGLDSA